MYADESLSGFLIRAVQDVYPLNYIYSDLELTKNSKTLKPLNYNLDARELSQNDLNYIGNVVPSLISFLVMQIHAGSWLKPFRNSLSTILLIRISQAMETVSNIEKGYLLVIVIMRLKTLSLYSHLDLDLVTQALIILNWLLIKIKLQIQKQFKSA